MSSGFSAGGHLAGHVALAPDAPAIQRPDFAVLAYPVVSMLLDTHRASRENLLGTRAWWWQRRAVSLEHLVTAESPPMFIWHTARPTP
jgi:acetyl esterase/lipase